MTAASSPADLAAIADKIKRWGEALGFQKVGITDLNLAAHEQWLQQWLDNNYHGSMGYMANHGLMRARPSELQPGSVRAICVRIDYLPPNAEFAKTLSHPERGYISRYAGGRDYHKMMRQRLKKLAEKIASELPELDYRPFVDSAPILERPLANKAGLGWVGKHSLLLQKEVGSWFFIGELLVNIPLPIDAPSSDDCGSCTACMTACPTGAIVKDYVVDARRCISYLTIEHEGAIDPALRPLLGNRIYGCDDCQLVCPVNQGAQLTAESDFHTKPHLHQPQLLDLFNWTEQEFLERLAGSPIRRIGFERWQRNISVAMGNADYCEDFVKILQQKLTTPNNHLKEHFQWAIEQQLQSKGKSLSHRKSSRLARIVSKGLKRDA
ncbi:tRNA epoxyqueuosine(34) reductase QueG [Paraferrimonas haliotis]|uniref:Epoxyqueuosine reductase n=1 Tax=Paraferrimonas haliotis TaxID=2013866 RepID=A0AA37WWK4_9GAMM|nr:tRNA epoxyqueuosine(34) reductase QueG [Paraferrimonas haliotis]GLS83613.1 epoxyqueuosine reductase [Paraferrimonas haliotis]